MRLLSDISQRVLYLHIWLMRYLVREDTVLLLNNFILVVFFVTVTKGRRVYLGLSLRRDAFHQSGTVWLLAIVSGVRKQIKAVPSLLAPVSFLFSLGPA